VTQAGLILGDADTIKAEARSIRTSTCNIDKATAQKCSGRPQPPDVKTTSYGQEGELRMAQRPAAYSPDIAAH